ncbi:MAG: glycosyltransferase [Flavisolibacter sp.]
MRRKRILWLVSWYPNKNDRYTGDFIQRHAKAACIYNDIYVIFLTEADKGQREQTEKIEYTGLTEVIIYNKKRKGILGRLLKQLSWKRSFSKAIQSYINENGIPDLVHVHIPWKAGVIALELKKQKGIPYILSEHWSIYNDMVEDNFNRQPVFIQSFIKAVYLQSELIVSVSKFLLMDMKKRLGEKYGIVLPNVVDTTLFHYSESKYSKFTFIHVSNMVPLKNVNLILDAFSYLIQNHNDVNAQFIFIGNANDQYIKYADSLGLLNKTVFFKGEVLYNEVAEEMKKSHALIIYSDIETFSCVTAEALCCGLPVIASSVGALPELINETNGVLVAPKDKLALVHAMKAIYTNYSSYNGKNISFAASAMYSYSTISEEFKELYSNVVIHSTVT